MSMNESCDQVRERVSLWLDHQLPAGERASLGAHLDVCVGCRGEFETFAALSRRVRALEPDELSDTFASEIRSLAIGPPKPVAWWQRPMATRIAASVLVCLGLALSYYLGRENGLDRGVLAPETSVIAGKEISYDMQTRAARSVLGDLAVIDRLPKTYQQPVLASQLKRFDLAAWTQAPQTAKDPMLSRAAGILRQLETAIETPGGLKGDRLLRLKHQAAKLNSDGWRLSATVKRFPARAAAGLPSRRIFASKNGWDNLALIQRVAPQCSHQDQKELNNFLSLKECVIAEDPFSAVMICRDVDMNSSFGSFFGLVVDQHMEDVGFEVRRDAEGAAEALSFSFGSSISKHLPSKQRRGIAGSESLEARIRTLFADKLDGELIIKESLEEEGTQSLQITIIRRDK